MREVKLGDAHWKGGSMMGWTIGWWCLLSLSVLFSVKHYAWSKSLSRTATTYKHELQSASFIYSTEIIIRFHRILLVSEDWVWTTDGVVRVLRCACFIISFLINGALGAGGPD